MIFCFIAPSLGVSEAVISFIQTLDKSQPNSIHGLSYDDAKTLQYLLPLPPHMLTLEDMVFSHTTVQKAWEATPAAERHHISISLAQNISIEDRNGCCVYYVPSSKSNNKILQF